MVAIAIISVVALVLDRVSKIVMVNHVFDIANLTAETYTKPVTVINGILDFEYLGNDGMSWGMLGGKKALLIILCLAILGVIGFVIYKTKPESIVEKLSYGMIIGGAIGNLVDRIMHGFVIDFIKVRFIEFPTFNLADCFVVVGAILLCIYVLFFDKKEDEVGKD